jgi:DNA-binding CsgD family transcriptional regulator
MRALLKTKLILLRHKLKYFFTFRFLFRKRLRKNIIEKGNFVIKTGFNLIPLIAPKLNGPLLQKISFIRSQVLRDFGINIKGVRVMDDLVLGENQYQIIFEDNIIYTETIAYSPEASDKIALKFISIIKEQLTNQERQFEEISEKFNLTEREVEIIKLAIKGKSNKDIANTLFISVSTVKQHLQNIFSKTKVNNRYGLITLTQIT